MQIPEKGKQLFTVSFDLFMSLSIVSRSVPELVEGPTASLIPGLPRNLPKRGLQKRRPGRSGATCAPQRRGVCCIWGRAGAILQ